VTVRIGRSRFPPIEAHEPGNSEADLVGGLASGHEVDHTRKEEGRSDRLSLVPKQVRGSPSRSPLHASGESYQGPAGGGSYSLWPEGCSATTPKVGSNSWPLVRTFANIVLRTPPSGARPDRPGCRRGNWLCRGSGRAGSRGPGLPPHREGRQGEPASPVSPLRRALRVLLLETWDKGAPRAHAYRGKELLRGGPTLTLRTDEGVASGPQSEGTEEVGPRSR